MKLSWYSVVDWVCEYVFCLVLLEIFFSSAIQNEIELAEIKMPENTHSFFLFCSKFGISRRILKSIFRMDILYGRAKSCAHIYAARKMEENNLRQFFLLLRSISFLICVCIISRCRKFVRVVTINIQCVCMCKTESKRITSKCNWK